MALDDRQRHNFYSYLNGSGAYEGSEEDFNKIADDDGQRHNLYSYVKGRGMYEGSEDDFNSMLRIEPQLKQSAASEVASAADAGKVKLPTVKNASDAMMSVANAPQIRPAAVPQNGTDRNKPQTQTQNGVGVRRPDGNGVRPDGNASGTVVQKAGAGAQGGNGLSMSYEQMVAMTTPDDKVKSAFDATKRVMGDFVSAMTGEKMFGGSGSKKTNVYYDRWGMGVQNATHDFFYKQGIDKQIDRVLGLGEAAAQSVVDKNNAAAMSVTGDAGWRDEFGVGGNQLQGGMNFVQGEIARRAFNDPQKVMNRINSMFDIYGNKDEGELNGVQAKFRRDLEGFVWKQVGIERDWLKRLSMSANGMADVKSDGNAAGTAAGTDGDASGVVAGASAPGNDVVKAGAMTEAEKELLRNMYSDKLTMVVGALQTEMQRYLQDKSAPSNIVEYVGREAINKSLVGQLVNVLIDKAAGDSGLRAQLLAQGEQQFLDAMDDGSLGGWLAKYGTKTAGSVAPLLLDAWSFEVGNVLGGKAAAKLFSEEVLKKSATNRVLRNSLVSGISFGTYGVMGEAVNQIRTGEFDPVNFGLVAGKEFLKGAITGVTGGTTSEFLQQTNSRLFGNVVTRNALPFLVEGATFSGMGIAEKWLENGGQISSSDIEDELIDNFSLIAGMKVAHAVQHPAETFSQMRQNRQAMEKAGMKLSREAEAEMAKLGYDVRGLGVDGKVWDRMMAEDESWSPVLVRDNKEGGKARIVNKPDGKASGTVADGKASGTGGGKNGGGNGRNGGETAEDVQQVVNMYNAIMQDSRVPLKWKSAISAIVTGKMIQGKAMSRSEIEQGENGKAVVRTYDADGTLLDVETGDAGMMQILHDNYMIEAGRNSAYMSEKAITNQGNVFNESVVMLSREGEYSVEEIVNAVNAKAMKMATDEQLEICDKLTAEMKERAANGSVGMIKDARERVKEATGVDVAEVMSIGANEYRKKNTNVDDAQIRSAIDMYNEELVGVSDYQKNVSEFDASRLKVAKDGAEIAKRNNPDEIRSVGNDIIEASKLLSEEEYTALEEAINDAGAEKLYKLIRDTEAADPEKAQVMKRLLDAIDKKSGMSQEVARVVREQTDAKRKELEALSSPSVEGEGRSVVYATMGKGQSARRVAVLNYSPDSETVVFALLTPDGKPVIDSKTGEVQKMQSTNKGMFSDYEVNDLDEMVDSYRDEVSKSMYSDFDHNIRHNKLTAKDVQVNTPVPVLSQNGTPITVMAISYNTESNNGAGEVVFRYVEQTKKGEWKYRGDAVERVTIEGWKRLQDEYNDDVDERRAEAERTGQMDERTMKARRYEEEQVRKAQEEAQAKEAAKEEAARRRQEEADAKAKADAEEAERQRLIDEARAKREAEEAEARRKEEEVKPAGNAAGTVAEAEVKPDGEVAGPVVDRPDGEASGTVAEARPVAGDGRVVRSHIQAGTEIVGEVKGKQRRYVVENVADGQATVRIETEGQPSITVVDEVDKLVEAANSQKMTVEKRGRLREAVELDDLTSRVGEDNVEDYLKIQQEDAQEQIDAYDASGKVKALNRRTDLTREQKEAEAGRIYAEARQLQEDLAHWQMLDRIRRQGEDVVTDATIASEIASADWRDKLATMTDAERLEEARTAHEERMRRADVAERNGQLSEQAVKDVDGILKQYVDGGSRVDKMRAVSRLAKTIDDMTDDYDSMPALDKVRDDLRRRRTEIENDSKLSAEEKRSRLDALKRAEMVLRNKRGRIKKLAGVADIEEVVDGEGNVVATAGEGIIELNVVTAQDKESRDYIRRVAHDMGMSDVMIDDLLSRLDQVADKVMEVAERYPSFREWQKKGLDKTRQHLERFGLVPKVSAFRNNGDYKYNIDLGSLCTRREALDMLMSEVIRRGKAQNLGALQIQLLRDVLKKYGYLVQCDICFVETKRGKALQQANDWANEWNAVADVIGIGEAEGTEIGDVNMIGSNIELTDEQKSILERLAAGDASAIPEARRRHARIKIESAKRVRVYDGLKDEAPDDQSKSGGRKVTVSDLDHGITASNAQKIAKLMLETPKLVGRWNAVWNMTTDGGNRIETEFADTSLPNTLAAAFGVYTAKPTKGYTVYDPLSWRLGIDNTLSVDHDKRLQDFIDIGGSRGQSFTDFNPMLFFDYVQKFVDYEARDIPGHEYTKVEWHPLLFGETGLKINMSLVPAIDKSLPRELAGFREDANGEFEYEGKRYSLAYVDECFPVEGEHSAFELRKRPEFEGNVGTICVAVGDLHIRHLLGREDIDMVIPFHASGMDESVRAKTNLDYANDYTDQQTTKNVPSAEKRKTEGYKEKNKELKGCLLANGEFSFNKAMNHLGDARKAADAYLEWCKINGCTPKFEQFADHPNYYKLLADFRCYDNDGNPSLQRPVRLKLAEDWQSTLDAALKDRKVTEEHQDEMVSNDELMRDVDKALNMQRLDGDLRSVYEGRLKSVLGSDNVQILTTGEFMKELNSRLNDEQKEVLRNGNGEVYGFAVGRKIYLNSDRMNADTTAHEYTHIWAKVVRGRNEKLWRRGVELLKESDEWQEVMNDDLYSNIWDNEEAVASEVLARVVGRMNADFVAGIYDPDNIRATSLTYKEKIWKWFKEAWGEVRKTFGKGSYKDLTFEEFSKMPLRDLLNENSGFKENASAYFKAHPEADAKAKEKKFKQRKKETDEEYEERVRAEKERVEALNGEGRATEFSIVTDEKRKEWWEEQKRAGKLVKTYKTVAVDKDGNMIAPMANKVSSASTTRDKEETGNYEFGTLLQSDERPDKAELAGENYKINIIRDDGKPTKVAYNPYDHSSDSTMNDQFKSAWERDNLIVIEEWVSQDDLDEAYHADKAKDPTGLHEWKQGVVGRQLPDDQMRHVYLSRWTEPIRQVDWDVVAQEWIDKCTKNDIEVPFNVVPKVIRDRIADAGVKIVEPEKGMGKNCFDAYEEWKASREDKGPDGPDGPGGGVAPEREEGESVLDYADRVAEWSRNRAASAGPDGKASGTVAESYKEAQNNLIEANNPHDDELSEHTWIRSAEDIKTFDEAMKEYAGDDVTPDFTAADVEVARKSGKLKVYSSKPIENGVFVTPSRMEAEGYAGGGRVYEKTVRLEQVAWIDGVEGQYADVRPDGKASGTVDERKAEAERLATEAVVTSLKENAGLNLHMVSQEEGLRAADENDGNAELMGASKRKRKMGNIAEAMNSANMDSDQKKVYNAFVNESEAEQITVTDEDGVDRTLNLVLGSENGIGVLHAIFRHAGTDSNYITSEDLLSVPSLFATGERSSGNAANRYNYTSTDENGNRTVLVTEKRGESEIFVDLYTNKKAPNPQPLLQGESQAHNAQRHTVDGNGANRTLPQADETISYAKVVNNSDTSKKNAENQHSDVEFMQRPNGTVYGWSKGNRIYLTPEGVNPNTPIHEYTHLWAKAVEKKAPELWDNVKSLMKQVPEWDEVMKDEAYEDIRDDENRVASEVLSRFSGKKGAEKMEQMAREMLDEAKGDEKKEAGVRQLIERVKAAVADTWKWIGENVFGIEKFDSAEEVADRVLYDLLNKTDLELDEKGGESEFAREGADGRRSIPARDRSLGDPLDLEDYVTRELASGRLKLSWDDMGSKRGLATHLGWTRRSEEKAARSGAGSYLATEDGGALSVDEAAHTLLEGWEAYTHMSEDELGMGANDVLNVLLDAVVNNNKRGDLMTSAERRRGAADEEMDEMMKADYAISAGFRSVEEYEAHEAEKQRAYDEVKETFADADKDKLNELADNYQRLMQEAGRAHQANPTRGTLNTAEVARERWHAVVDMLDERASKAKARRRKKKPAGDAAGTVAGPAGDAAGTVAGADGEASGTVAERPVVPAREEGESVFDYADRVAEALKAQKKYDREHPVETMTRDEAMKEVRARIDAELKRDVVSNMDKRTLNAILATLARTDVDNLELMLKEASRLVAHVEMKGNAAELEKLYKFKTTDVNGKNMSIAKSVDEDAQKIFRRLNMTVKEVSLSGFEDEIHKLRSQNWHLRSEKLTASEDRKTEIDLQIESNNLRIEGLEDEKLRVLEEKAVAGVDGLSDKIAELTEKMNSAAEGVGKFTKDDVIMLTACRLQEQVAELYKQNSEMIKLEKELRGIKQQRYELWAEKWKPLYDEQREKIARLDAEVKRLEAEELVASNPTEVHDRLLEARGELDEARQEFSEMRDEYKVQRVMLENKILGYNDIIASAQGNVKDAQRTLIKSMKEIIENGRESLKNKINEELKRHIEVVSGSIGSVTGKGTEKVDVQEVEKRHNERAMKRLFTAAISSFEYLSQAIETRTLGRDGYFYQRFVMSKDGVIAANDNYLRGVQVAAETLDSKTAEIYGKGKKWLDVWHEMDKTPKRGKWGKKRGEYGADGKPLTTGIFITDMSKVDADGIPTGETIELDKMSKSQAMYVYMVWKMTDGKSKLMNQGFTEDSIEQIRRYIGGENVALADWLQDNFFKETREKYNAKYREIYHTDLAEIANYVPLRILASARYEEKDMSGDSGKGAGKLVVKNGALVNRVANMLPADLSTSAFEVVWKHMTDMEEFAAFADVRRDLQWVFSSNKFRNQLDMNSKGMYSRLETAAEMAVHTYQPESGKLDHTMAVIQKGLVGGNIAFRNTTALKQMLSLPAFLGYSQNPKFCAMLLRNTFDVYGGSSPALITDMMTFGTLGKRIFNNRKKSEEYFKSGMSKTIKWCMDNMPDFYERVLKGTAGDNRLDEEGWSNWFGEMQKKYLETGMVSNQMVDAMTCAVGIKTIYDYKYGREKERIEKQADKHDDWSDEQKAEWKKQQMEEAHRQAVVEAEIYYNATQQSGHQAFLSPMQVSRTMVDRAMSMYKNCSIGFARKFVEDMQDAKRLMHWRDMVGEYAKKYMREDPDMSEEDARKEASRYLQNEARKTAFSAQLYGFWMNYVWDKGGKGLLGLLSTAGGILALQDEDEAQEDENENGLYRFAKLVAMLTKFPGRGISGMDMLSGVLNGEPFSFSLITDEVQDIIKQGDKVAEEYGYISPEMAYLICSRISKVCGVTIDAWTNVYLGLERMARDGVWDGDEAIVDLMLLLNSPERNRAEVARNIFRGRSDEEYIAAVEKACKYKVEADDWEDWLPNLRELKDAQRTKLEKELLALNMSDADREMYVANKELEAQVEGLTTLDEAMEMYDREAAVNVRNLIMKRISELLKADKPKKSVTDKKKDLLKVPGVKKLSASDKEYMLRSTGEDIVEDMKLSARKSELKKVYDEYKAKDEDYDYYEKHRKEIDEYEAIDEAQKQIRELKNDLTEDDEAMKEIRKVRKAVVK